MGDEALRDLGAPWLALACYQEALDAYVHGQGDYVKAFSLAKQMASLAYKNKWYGRAQILYQEALSYPLYGILQEDVRQCWEQLNILRQEQLNLEKEIDLDLHAQLTHARETFALLQVYLLELYENPTDLPLIERAQGTIADLLIKVRHLFDQAMGRFVKECLYANEVMPIWDAKYPCAKEEAYFDSDFFVVRKQLEKLSAKTSDEFKKRVESNLINDKGEYNALYRKIKETQPFAEGLNKNSCLSTLVDYTNRLKHAGFEAPCADLLLSQRELFADAILDFYPISGLDLGQSVAQLLDKALEQAGEILSTIFQHIRKKQSDMDFEASQACAAILEQIKTNAIALDAPPPVIGEQHLGFFSEKSRTEARKSPEKTFSSGINRNKNSFLSSFVEKDDVMRVQTDSLLSQADDQGNGDEKAKALLMQNQLIRVCRDPDLEKVRRLLQQGASPKLCNDKGEDPLAAAIFGGSVDVFQVLEEYKRREDGTGYSNQHIEACVKQVLQWKEKSEGECFEVSEAMLSYLKARNLSSQQWEELKGTQKEKPSYAFGL